MKKATIILHPNGEKTFVVSWEIAKSRNMNKPVSQLEFESFVKRHKLTPTEVEAEVRPQHCKKPMNRCGKRGDVQQWRCPVCGHTQRDKKRPMGRPCLGDEPLTGAERWRRWKERHS